MDIIIRNGIIQIDEAKRIREIKNNAGLLKKDYRDYIKGIPGPYYDLLNCHICVPRRFDQIVNFSGAQIKNNIKLIDTQKYDKKVKYCCICHCLMKPNPSYCAKKKIFIEENLYTPQPKVILTKNKVKDSEKKQEKKQEKKPKNINKDKTYSDKWINLYDNLYHIMREKQIVNYKNLQKKYVNKYYIFVYKLTKKPILYFISNTETKLIWPWNLTPYQKFKLSNPNYKATPMFSHSRNNRIVENYVIIE